jgi:hypothetical protein
MPSARPAAQAVLMLLAYGAAASALACSSHDEPGGCRACRGRSGSVEVTGTMPTDCPWIQSMSFSPATAHLGESVVLAGEADVADGGSLTWLWSASFGTILQPNEPASSYRCDVVGTPSITLTISTGDCSDSVSADVVCEMAAQGAATTGSSLVSETGARPIE